MLYESFNSINESFGIDFFTSRLDDEAVRNLNPKFELREIRKKRLAGLIFILKNIKKKMAGAFAFPHGNWLRKNTDHGSQHFTALPTWLSKFHFLCK
jgi:hypothetical protein